MSAEFYINCILFGLSLAADGFVITFVGGASGVKRRAIGAAAVFALFQGAAPMLGWTCAHMIARAGLKEWLDLAAFALLSAIGLKMIFSKGETGKSRTVILQAAATSADSLSAGLANAEYSLCMAIVFSAIAAALTFVACSIGPTLGRRSARGRDYFGAQGKCGVRSETRAAEIVGGVILIAIGAGAV